MASTAVLKRNSVNQSYLVCTINELSLAIPLSQTLGVCEFNCHDFIDDNICLGSTNFRFQKAAIINPKFFSSEHYSEGTFPSVVFIATNHGTIGLPVQEVKQISSSTNTRNLNYLNTLSKYGGVIETDDSFAMLFDIERFLPEKKLAHTFNLIIKPKDVFLENYVFNLGLIEKMLDSNNHIEYKFDPENTDDSKIPKDVFALLSECLSLIKAKPFKLDLSNIIPSDVYQNSVRLSSHLSEKVYLSEEVNSYLRHREDVVNEIISKLKRDIIPGDVYQVVTAIKKKLN